MSESSHSNKAKSTQTNLASLLFCTLSIISICLSSFNLYLFTWIWARLGGEQTSGQGGALAWAQLEPGAQDLLRLGLRVVSKRKLQANQLRGQTLSVLANGRLAFQANKTNLMQLDAGGQQLQRPASLLFPLGLQVAGLVGEQNSSSGPVLRCARNWCKLRAIETLSLGRGQGGVDFCGQSMRVQQVRARRIHSRLDKLQLASGGLVLRLGSRTGRLQAMALDTLRLVVGQSSAARKQNVSLGGREINEFSSTHSTSRLTNNSNRLPAFQQTKKQQPMNG